LTTNSAPVLKSGENGTPGPKSGDGMRGTGIPTFWTGSTIPPLFRTGAEIPHKLCLLLKLFMRWDWSNIDSTVTAQVVINTTK